RFCFADGELFGDDCVAGVRLGFALGEVQQSAGVADADGSGDERVFDARAKPKQAQKVGNGGAVLAGALGDLVVIEAVIGGEAVEGGGDFYGIEVFALDIFDQ